MCMLKNVFLLIVLVLGLTPVAAQGEMSFHLDFGQDGSYENSYPMNVGERVVLDVYVSNVPEPGLKSMGFYLSYDELALQLDPAGTQVDGTTWPLRYDNHAVPGQLEMAGGRIINGIYGNDIKLATITFTVLEEVEVNLWLLDRGDTVDNFVLSNGSVIDSDLGTGVQLGSFITALPGDIDGDGDIDGYDLALLASQYNVCTNSCSSDIDGDGDVDKNDLSALAINYGIIY